MNKEIKSAYCLIDQLNIALQQERFDCFQSYTQISRCLNLLLLIMASDKVFLSPFPRYHVIKKLGHRTYLVEDVEDRYTL